MAIDMANLPTVITIQEPFRSRYGNLTFEDAKFFGRPNFAGEMNQFKDNKRQFTVLVPNELADQLRDLGWNVKTRLPETEEQETISLLKVAVDDGSDVWIIMGDSKEKLNVEQFAILDRSRIASMHFEVRGWEYDPQDKPGQLSARLVQFVAEIQPNILGARFGLL